jgi:signal peptidase I
LRQGDVLLVRTHAYERAEPLRGDLVLAQVDGEILAKRIVGLPSEVLEVRQGRVLINHACLEEQYVAGPSTLDIGPGQLVCGKYALLGDNRQVSASEVIHAVVDREQLLGKVVAVWRWLRDTEVERD